MKLERPRRGRLTKNSAPLAARRSWDGAGASEGVENVEGCLVRAGQTREGAPAKHALSLFGA